jgi:hypothetical protein
VIGAAVRPDAPLRLWWRLYKDTRAKPCGRDTHGPMQAGAAGDRSVGEATRTHRARDKSRIELATLLVVRMGRLLGKDGQRVRPLAAGHAAGRVWPVPAGCEPSHAGEFAL